MAERIWTHITTGATFEALVMTLVFFEDPKAILFGRPGKDGGQDVRSGDGTRVFQAKHHEDGSAAKAIADAKKEAAKVAEYRKKGHARHDQWKEVACWRLVTNASFNPTNHQAWLDEVVPLFRAIGLVADYWERAHLNALLDKWPEVDRSFFGNEARAFLSLPEVKERVLQDEPFLQRSSKSFVGRTQELDRIAEFLKKTHSFLVVHGAGGAGKTRLIVEAGTAAIDEGWQVLWANVATLVAGTSWFDAVVPERRTVLLVDEPEDEQVLRLLAEHLGGHVGRATQWKVIVAVRSPKDPVLKFLSGPRLRTRVETLAVDPLSKDAATQMCRDLLAEGSLNTTPTKWREEVATRLAERFSRQPVWLTLAVHLLETHGDINKVPENAAALADVYLEEVTRHQSSETPERVLELLRWIALIGTVNRENEGLVRMIAQNMKTDVDTTLASIARLVERRALRQRGAHSRIVELKPDVLRDHLLRKWLVVEVGFGVQPLKPSEAAKQLVESCSAALEKGGLSGVGLAVLKSIGRTEILFSMDERPVPLLDPFFERVRGHLGELSASVRIALCETLSEIAWIRPSDVVAISRALRTTPGETEVITSFFGTREVSNDDVLLHLAWPVFQAAMGAREPDERFEVLQELVELTRLETEVGARRRGGLPNDGRRAAQLVGRTLEGGPYYWSDYDDAVCRLALRLIEDVRSAPTKGAREALRSLVVPAVAVERHQEWSNDTILTFRKYVIMPGHPGWETRKQIRTKLKEKLTDDSLPLEALAALWELFVESHRLANYVALHGPSKFKELMHAEFLDDLRWSLEILKRHGARLEEMKAARDLWEWHAKYEKDLVIKAAADALENLYNADTLAAEFEPLLEFDTLQQVEERAREKAMKLVGSGEHEIEDFVKRGVQYLQDTERFYALNIVASELGAIAATHPQPRAFVAKVVSEPSDEVRMQFAMTMVSRWVFTTRSTDKQRALVLMRELLSSCTDDATKVRLLIEVYGNNAPKMKHDEVASDEHAFIRSHAELFRREGKTDWFIALVSWTLSYEWAAYKSLIESELSGLTEPALTHGVAALIQGVFWATYKRDGEEFPPDLGSWFLNQILRVRDFNKLGGNTQYRIDEVLKIVGLVAPSWLPGALRQRAAMEKAEGYGKAKALSHDVVLSDYVRQIEQPQQDDPEIERIVSELLDLVGDQGSVGYRLPDILHHIDPLGFVVPRQLGKRMRSDTSTARKCARIARAYGVNTGAWRQSVLPIMELALKLDAADRRSVFSSIAEAGVRSWSGKVGEVSRVFSDAVETARAYRDRETDDRFLPFWDWFVAVAEEDLRQKEEEAKEERGE